MEKPARIEVISKKNYFFFVLTWTARQPVWVKELHTYIHM